MSLKEHVVDNPEDFDKLLIPKSEWENDGNTPAKDKGKAEEPAPQTKDSDQSEDKQEDENLIWDGSK